MADTQAARRRGGGGVGGKKPKGRGGGSSISATVSERILEAVASGKAGRRGISLAALKKLLSGSGYDVAANKWRLRQAVRSLVSKGSLVQTSGSGASGSFKLPTGEEAAAADRPDRMPRKRESPAAPGRGSRKAAVKRPKRRLAPRKMRRGSAKKAVARGGRKGARSPGKRGRKAAARRPARGGRKPRAKPRRGVAKPRQEQQQEEEKENSQAPAPEETSASEKTSQACSEIAGNV